jgi:predicted MFS family arabinose efflux permease
MAKNKAGFTLGLLSIAYVHCAASGFLVSALLPAISVDLKLSDGEGALLTTLFTVVYSLCLPLLGIAADKTNRKNLLAAGAFIWTRARLLKEGDEAEMRRIMCHIRD